MDQTQTRHAPPMPKFLFKIVNQLIKLVLRSPLHGRMSGRLMVLSFKGSKSGKYFSTPVGYVRSGSDIFVFTHSGWRNNFKQPAPVSMRIQGQDVSGNARLVSDPERIRQMIETLIASNGEQMSKQMGFYVENIHTASVDEIRTATGGTYFIEIQTDGRK